MVILSLLSVILIQVQIVEFAVFVGVKVIRHWPFTFTDHVPL